MPFNRRFRLAAGRVSVGLSVAGIVTAATLCATHPAAAAAALTAMQNAVTCGSKSACFLATNSSSGPGVAGTSAGIGIQGKGITGVKGLATSGYGIFGQSTSGSAGVAGTTASRDGVYGYTTSNGIGVHGVSAGGYGIYGSTTDGTGVGVVGSVNADGIGVYGASSSSYGVQGLSSSGYALYGDAYGSGTAAYLAAESGGYGLIAYSNGSPTIYGRNANGNGADLGGSYIALVARTPASNGYSFVATDPNGNNLFYVDSGGNVSYHGGLFKFAHVRGGALVKSFSPNTTAPTVEDTGTAQLVGGAASVRLDPTFAASIDAASSYRVFVTPGGDTRGLFVAGKTATGFLVRESQGGRSTVSFDYRIVATAAGQAGQRIAVVNATTEPHAAEPHAPRFTTKPIAAAARP